MNNNSFKGQPVPQTAFKQTSSIVNRLRLIMITIALFFVFSIVALYITSWSNLKGLQSLNSANQLLNINSRTIHLLNLIENDLDKINHSKIFENSLEINSRIILSLTKESIRLVNGSHFNNELSQMMNYATTLVNQLNLQYKMIIEHFLDLPENESLLEHIKEDLDVAKAMLQEIKIAFEKIQISIKEQNDSNLQKIYSDRFKPLSVMIILFSLFFIYVITFGLSTSKKIGKSLGNLVSAADRVARGNLIEPVKIIDNDEIGRLTNAFNRMIYSLRTGQEKLMNAMDKTSRLHTLNAAFSEALTADKVYEVMFKQAFEALGASAGSIALLCENNNYLDLKKFNDGKSNLSYKWQRLPLSADVLAAKTIKTKTPIFIQNEETIACLPLIINNETIGSLSFYFEGAKDFEADDKEFIISLSRQCAQAIYRSQLYDDAKKSISVRDEFLSIASHELRTPLTPLKLQIQNLARLLKKGDADKLSREKLEKMAENSDRQIKRLSGLIDDLLDVSRITSGKLNLNREVFSIKEIVDEVVNRYSPYLKDMNSFVEITTEEDTVGNWDKLRIEQVLVNLLANAAKYAPSRPVQIKITKEGQMAKILIQDEGPGIAPEDRERIFNRFERIPSPRNVGGLGLGLYLSKQIIEAHKGKIYVTDSSSIGSVFTVELPWENQA